MSNGNTAQQIQERVDAFIVEVTDLARQSALNAIQQALNGASAAPRAAAPARRGPGRPRKVAATKAGAKRVRKGTRRSEADVDATGAMTLAYIQAHDRCSVSDIGGELGLTPKDLRLPLLKLIDEGKIHTTGQRRGTRYHAGKGRGGAAKRTTKKKASKKRAKRTTRKTA